MRLDAGTGRHFIHACMIKTEVASASNNDNSILQSSLDRQQHPLRKSDHLSRFMAASSSSLRSRGGSAKSSSSLQTEARHSDIWRHHVSQAWILRHPSADSRTAPHTPCQLWQCEFHSPESRKRHLAQRKHEEAHSRNAQRSRYSTTTKLQRRAPKHAHQLKAARSAHHHHRQYKLIRDATKRPRTCPGPPSPPGAWASRIPVPHSRPARHPSRRRCRRPCRGRGRPDRGLAPSALQHGCGKDAGG